MYNHWRENSWQAVDDSYQLAWLFADASEGGADFHEVMRAAQRIRFGVAEDWAAAFATLGDRTRQMGDDAAAAGHLVTAGACYLRAFSYYRAAELRIDPGDRRKAQVYRSAVEAWRDGLRLSGDRHEPVGIPFRQAELHGHLFLPQEDRAAPAPCVVVLGDEETICEANLFRVVRYVTARGAACLIVDGPGQGAALRTGKLPAILEAERPVSAVIDWLVSRSDVDGRNVGLLGYGLGGHQALRAAAFDRRVGACVALGAMYDVLHDLYLAYPPSRKQLAWMSGSAGDDVHAFYRRFSLEGLLPGISCPVLMVHGTWDKKVPLASAQRIREELRSGAAELKTFDDVSGGGAHCGVDNWPEVISGAVDWLLEHQQVPAG